MLLPRYPKAATYAFTELDGLTTGHACMLKQQKSACGPLQKAQLSKGHGEKVTDTAAVEPHLYCSIQHKLPLILIYMPMHLA